MGVQRSNWVSAEHSLAIDSRMGNIMTYTSHFAVLKMVCSS